MRQPCERRRDPLPDFAGLEGAYIQSLSTVERDQALKADTSVYGAFTPVLEMTLRMVVEADGAQIWAIEDWSMWIGKHPNEWRKLQDKVMEYAGLQVEEEKKGSAGTLNVVSNS